MSDIKGYVVRGKDKRGNKVTPAGDPCGSLQAATLFASSMEVEHGCTDVRIFAVGKDGTETPLPTYAEALDEVWQLCAEVNLARGRTMAALAEAARLRAEVAAWIRLVKAERAHHDQTDLLGERDDDMKGAWGEVDAALQALRELGVDVDVLLKLQETEEGRNR